MGSYADMEREKVKKKLMATATAAALIVLILASYPLKFIHFNDPYFGAYLSRQLQTMSTIDAYAAQGIDFMHPRTNYAGWPGHLIFEFPIFQAMAALVSEITDSPLAATRVLNLVFGTLSISLVYAISRFWFDRRAAAYSSLFFAWSPLNIMFHRSTMIDIFCVFLALASQLILMHWLARRKWWLGILFCLTGILCVLIKPPYFLPVLVLFAVQLVLESLPFSWKRLRTTVCSYSGVFFSLLLMAGGLIYWLALTQPTASGHGVFRHLGLEQLLNPQYYFKFLYRFMEHYVTPFNALLFMVGIFLLLQKDRKTPRIQLLIAPILYYALFPNVNSPHSYYSLVMIPYFAMMSGYGARWLEEMLQREGVIKNISISRLLIAGISIFTCTLMFLRGWTSFMVLPQQRYAQMAKEVGSRLEPMNYAVVYVNLKGDFAGWEYLRNQPVLYLKSFFKDIGEEELKREDSDSPLVRSAVLYALKQYGGVDYVNSINETNVAETVRTYNGHLRYVMFYLFDDRNTVQTNMGPVGARLIYESRDWIVYDLAEASHSLR